MFNLTASTEQDRGSLKAPSVVLMALALKPIEKAERAARARFNALSFDLEMDVGLRFCPISAWKALHDAMEEAKTEFNQAADEFVEKFSENLELVRAYWEEMADRQTKLDDTARALMKTVIRSYLPVNAPSRNKFSITMLWTELAVPGQPTLSELSPEDATIASDIYNKVREESEQNMRQMTSTFERTCRAELQSRLLAFFRSLGTTIQEGKSVNRRTLNRINSFVASLRQLNFMHDSTIDSLMGNLQRACFPNGVPENIASVDNAGMIQNIQEVLKDSTVKLELATLHSGTLSEALIIDAPVLNQMNMGVPRKLII
jgi:hypothetical protein